MDVSLNLQKDWSDVERVYCVLYGPQKDDVAKRLVYYPDKAAFLSDAGRYSCFYGETVTKVEKGGTDKKLGFTLSGAEGFYCFLSEHKSERDSWLKDVNAMVAAAKKAIAQARLEGMPYPSLSSDADAYTEGIPPYS